MNNKLIADAGNLPSPVKDYVNLLITANLSQGKCPPSRLEERGITPVCFDKQGWPETTGWDYDNPENANQYRMGKTFRLFRLGRSPVLMSSILINSRRLIDSEAWFSGCSLMLLDVQPPHSRQSRLFVDHVPYSQNPEQIMDWLEKGGYIIHRSLIVMDQVYMPQHRVRESVTVVPVDQGVRLLYNSKGNELYNFLIGHHGLAVVRLSETSEPEVTQIPWSKTGINLWMPR